MDQHATAFRNRCFAPERSRRSGIDHIFTLIAYPTNGTGADAMTDHRTTETTNQARQGETSNHMRWVLLFTLLLTIGGVGAVWLATIG